MRYFLFLILTLSIPAFVAGQERKIRYDTLYISDLSDSLALRVYGINKFNGFHLQDNFLGQQLEFSPNRNLNLGLGVNYKWYGLGIAVNPPLLNNDNARYGRTKRIDVQTNIFTHTLLIDFYGQFYKGFYITNPQLYIPTWNPSMNYPQRQDISLASLGGSVMYIFNHKKYSARAVFVHTELQKKSAGSFLMGGFVTAFQANGDSAFIPKQLFDRFSTVLRFSQFGVYSYGFSLGYSHTFVFWKRFYFSFTLIPGLAVSSYNVLYEAPLENRNGTVVSGRFLGRTAFGYNSFRTFGGFIASADSFTGKAGKDDNYQVFFEVGLFRFFYGMRFNFPHRKRATSH